jgi:hypothetical protein
MSDFLESEIATLVHEILTELGNVDHRILGTGPMHTGFPEQPTSLVTNKYYDLKMEEAYQFLGKALENFEIVVSELETRGQPPGDLLILTDQIKLAADGVAKYLGVNDRID